MKITFFKSEWDTYTPAEMSIDADWDTVAEMLISFVHVNTKEETEMYNLWEFVVKDGQIHRCAEDCIALHGLVIDYDQNLSLASAMDRFDGIECVVYTTFNHQLTGKDKYRVVIPFTHPMPVEEFNKKRAAMIDSFPGADRASFSRSQAIFLHSGPRKDLAFATRINGCKLDWTAFEDKEVTEYEPTEPTKRMNFTAGATYKAAVLKSLSTCKNIRHIASPTLAIIVKSCGGSFAEYCAICMVAGGVDSCIRDPKKQVETWEKFSNDMKIGKVKRDKFIADHGGVPIAMKKNDEIKTIMNKYRVGTK